MENGNKIEQEFSWDLGIPKGNYRNDLLSSIMDYPRPNPKNEFYIPRLYSRSYASPKFLQSTKRSVKYTPETVKLLLENPYANASKLQEISEYLWAVSPTYQNYLYDMATTMTFDYYLYPDGNISDKKVTIKNRFLESAKTVRNSRVKNNYPIMLLNALKLGSAYYYIQDDNNIIYDIMPNKICQLAFIDEDNLWRYWVDLSLIDISMKLSLPDEIIMAYDEWIKRGKKKTEVEKELYGVGYFIPDSYHLVSKAGNAIFAHMQKMANDYPFFASIFPDLLRLEENKTFFNEIVKENNIKTIHFQVPISPDGIPLMDGPIVEQFHEDAVRATGNNVTVITNPFKAEGISLDKSQQAGINLVEHSTDIVSNDAGISDAKFNADTTNGLKYSVNADAAKMYPFRDFFENIINYRLKRSKYKVTFLQIHRDNIIEWHGIYGADLLSGGSRFSWLSTTGIEIYDYLQNLEVEQLLDIDSLLIPKVSGSNMSGDDNLAKSGRPLIPEDDKADSTVKVEKTMVRKGY